MVIHYFLIVASQSQLQDVARLRALMLPSVSMLIRYLNVSTRQDYLVKRIHGEEEGERKGEGGKERTNYFIYKYVIRLYMYIQTNCNYQKL